MSAGWICLHREILDWEWYTDINTCHLFAHLLIRASHKERTYRGVQIKPGMVVAGRESLARETGLSPQKVRTALDKLVSTKEITITTTRQYSIIAIENWSRYQTINQEDNQQVTNDQPTDNHIQQGKKGTKKQFKAPSAAQVGEYMLSRVPTCTCVEKQARKFVDYHTARGWTVGKSRMRDWKAAVRTWIGHDFDKVFTKGTASMSL